MCLRGHRTRQGRDCVNLRVRPTHQGWCRVSLRVHLTHQGWCRVSLRVHLAHQGWCRVSLRVHLTHQAWCRVSLRVHLTHQVCRLHLTVRLTAIFDFAKTGRPRRNDCGCVRDSASPQWSQGGVSARPPNASGSKIESSFQFDDASDLMCEITLRVSQGFT